jgi:hypothetical protein
MELISDLQAIRKLLRVTNSRITFELKPSIQCISLLITIKKTIETGTKDT